MLYDISSVKICFLLFLTKDTMSFVSTRPEIIFGYGESKGSPKQGDYSGYPQDTF